MRTVFINTLTDIAKKDDSIFLLTADVGFSVFENFKSLFPKRFFDTGVAEQNTIGLSAGLALSGKTVFVYSIIPFITMRCFEQIRNDICMQNLNVKIIGIGAGLHYGPCGPSHHAIEDISIMRSLPNMKVISPGTPIETESAIKFTVKNKGPVYIRLGRTYGHINSIPVNKFMAGKGVLIKKGNHITIIATGGILYNAIETAKMLDKKGVSTQIINIHTIKPIDKEIILKAAKKTKAIFTIEEHSIIGGLGTSVSEVLAESNLKIPFKRIALPDNFVRHVGDRNYLLERNKLSIGSLYKTIARFITHIK